MRYPFGLVLDTVKHVAAKKLQGERRFPLMLWLDPLGKSSGTCRGNNDACNGAPMLSVDDCIAAMKECRTPIVSLYGGEPLRYPEIATLTRTILETGRHLFLCTDGTLIRQRLHMIPPYTNFFWDVKLDGTQNVHDALANRPGLFAEAIDGIKAAKNAGFFVVVSSSVCPKTDVGDLVELYDHLHALHVDGYFLLPHYPHQKLCRDGNAQFHKQMHAKFREASERLGDFNLLISPIYLEYLRGERELDCSVWAGPVRAPMGWSSPCSFVNSGYANTYKDLLDKTLWENYGRGLNPCCENCQCYDGYETSALLGMNPKAGDLWKLLTWQLSGGLGERRNGARRI